MAAVRENTVERRFNMLARRHGGLSLKWVSPGRLGVPDRLLFMPGGRLYLVELKRPGGKPRASQNAMFAKLETRGFHVWVVDDPDTFFDMILTSSPRFKPGDSSRPDDGRGSGL